MASGKATVIETQSEPILNRLRLESVQFVRIAADTSLRLDRSMPPAVVSFGFNRPRITAHGDHLTVQCSFTVSARADLNDKKTLATVRANIDVACEWTPNANRSISIEEQETLEVYAYFVAWPYWRELVHSAFARMTLPPLTVPMIRQQEIRDHILKTPRHEIVSAPPSAESQTASSAAVDEDHGA